MNLKRVQVGDQAPDFTLIDTEGNQISLSDFKGQKMVYLVFNRGFF